MNKLSLKYFDQTPDFYDDETDAMEIKKVATATTTTENNPETDVVDNSNYHFNNNDDANDANDIDTDDEQQPWIKAESTHRFGKVFRKSNQTLSRREIGEITNFL